jgi:adenylate cyclase
MRLRRAIFTQVAVSVIYTGAVYYLFRDYYFWLPLMLPALAALLGNLAMWAWHHLSQKRREEEILYTLTQYLPMEAAQKLSRNFNKLEQQRQLVQGVCLLTDIQGYTRLAETLPPGELHSLMNRYYAVLIKTVKEHGGFIGNLVGDGMLALWTVPEITPSTCHAALQTVLKIQERLAQDPDLHEKLPTCFGLHGGQFSLGNLGHTGHFEYSPVGDMINTAARIEHFNRQLGTRILCSAPIAEHLRQSLPIKLRFLGNFSLRNKAVPVALYTYVADASDDILVRFERAYEYFTCNQFDAALAEFAKLADEYADGPSRYFVNACRQELQPKK